jgi:hypothetical protein
MDFMLILVLLAFFGLTAGAVSAFAKLMEEKR